MTNYTGLSRLKKSDLFDFIYDRLDVNQISCFPWCKKKYVVMNYFSKQKLLEIAQTIYLNKYF